MAQPMAGEPIDSGASVEPEFDPQKIYYKKFGTVRKGYNPDEVSAYLGAIADALRDAQRRESEVRSRLGKAVRRASDAEEALEQTHEQLVATRTKAERLMLSPTEISDEELTERLGDEIAHVLQSARDAAETRIAHAKAEAHEIFTAAEARATDIRWKAELILGERTDEAEEVAADYLATAEQAAMDADRRSEEILQAAHDVAASLVEAARHECEGLIKQAQAARHQILADMDRRRRTMRSQAERLKAGRDRLLESHGIVQDALTEISNELRISVAEAKVKGDNAARRVESAPTSHAEALEVELADATLIGSVALPEIDRYEDSEAAEAARAIESRASGASGSIVDEAPAPVEEVTTDGHDAVVETAAAIADADAPAGDADNSEPIWADDGIASAIEELEAAVAEPMPAGADAEVETEIEVDAETTAEVVAEVEEPVADEPVDEVVEPVDAEPVDEVVEPVDAEPVDEVDEFVEPVDEEPVVEAAEPVADVVEAPTVPVEAAAEPEVVPEPEPVIDEPMAEITHLAEEPIAEPEPVEPVPEAVVPVPASADPDIAAPLAEPSLARVIRVVDSRDVQPLKLEPVVVTPADLRGELADDGTVETSEPEVAVDAAGNPMDDLFKRLRSDGDDDDGEEVELLPAAAELETDAAPETKTIEADAAEPEAAVEITDDVGDALSDPAGPTDAEIISRRDAALDDQDAVIERRLKRVLADELNVILGALGATKRKGNLADVLPTRSAHIDSYLSAVMPQVEQCFRAGGDFIDPARDVGMPDRTAFVEFLAADVVDPIRARIDELDDLGAAAAGADEVREVTDLVRSFYRAQKTERMAVAANRLAIGGFSMGGRAAMADGTIVRWVFFDHDEGCPDGHDNSFTPPQPIGDVFPSGVYLPPTAPLCRCVLVPLDR